MVADSLERDRLVAQAGFVRQPVRRIVELSPEHRQDEAVGPGRCSAVARSSSSRPPAGVGAGAPNAAGNEGGKLACRMTIERAIRHRTAAHEAAHCIAGYLVDLEAVEKLVSSDRFQVLATRLTTVLAERGGTGGQMSRSFLRSTIRSLSSTIRDGATASIVEGVGSMAERPKPSWPRPAAGPRVPTSLRGHRHEGVAPPNRPEGR